MSEIQKRLQELDQKIVDYRSMTVKDFQERRKEIMDAFVEFANLIKDQTAPNLLVSQFFYLSQAVKYGYTHPKTEERLVHLAMQISSSGAGDLLLEIEKVYPNNQDVILNIAIRAKNVGDTDKCVIYLNRALSMKMPKEKRMLCNLALAEIYMNQKDLNMSLYYAEKALELNNKSSESLNMLGVVFLSNHDSTNAIKYLKRALKYSKQDNEKSSCLLNLGLAQSFIRDFDEAEKSYNLSLGLNPKNHLSLQNMLLDTCYLTKYSMEDIYKKHLRLNEILEIDNGNFEKPKVIRKVGIVSGDLGKGAHPCSSFTEIFNSPRCVLYSTQQIDPNDYPKAKVRSVSHMTTQRIKELIKEDECDVLIDLSSCTRYNRQELFAKRSSPIQIQMLGYPTFVPLQTMDYFITDRNVQTPVTQALNGDKNLFMECAWCFSAKDFVIKERVGTNNVYGVTSKITKMSPEFMNVLKQISERDPDAMFHLKNSEFKMKSNKDFVLKYLPESKVKFIPWYSNPVEALEFYNDVDITLDTWPYSSCTNACDSLCAGTPIITLASETRDYQNTTKSLLMATGIPEYIANTEQEYIDLAISVASKKKFNKSLIRNQFISKVCNVERYSEEFFTLIDGLVQEKN
jgi:predicted O-linked N-acetylglucosamine transferase (SPINDLY family)